MFNCIVVDDEPLARQLILSYIDQVPGFHCAGNYGNAIEAFAALHEFPVDVIFIDIQMPGINGLSFIKSLKAPPKVIFITAFTEYAVEAFEIEATDYLLKPVTFDRFLKAVQKINTDKSTPATLSRQTSEMSSIFLKVDRRLVKIGLASIIYVEALGDYLKIHTKELTYVTYMSLGKIETLLPASGFTRIHRSTIINKSLIEFIEGNFVRLNNIDLSIGLTYKENLFKSIRDV